MFPTIPGAKVAQPPSIPTLPPFLPHLPHRGGLNLTKSQFLPEPRPSAYNYSRSYRKTTPD